MSKAEKIIQDCTRKDSNQLPIEDWGKRGVYKPWLTPDQARRVVKIAREEMIGKVCEYIASNMRCDGYTLQTKSKFIKDLKQAIKDE